MMAWCWRAAAGWLLLSWADCCCTCRITPAAWSRIQLTRDDYALPTLGPKLIELADMDVTNGRGFLLIK